MNESRKSRLKFDELRENNPAQKFSHEKQESQDQSLGIEDATYSHVGNTRNISLEWPDGRKMSFNYAYLISVELNINDDVNEITLIFSSHTVMLKGYRLNTLYGEIFTQRSRILFVADKRYVEANDDAYILTEIIVTENR